MNLYKLFIALSILLGLSSCNWLDLEPTDTTTETDLFKTGDGYRIALNGIYQQMSETDLYGQQLTWGLLDVLGQTYSSSFLGTAYYASANYKYTDNRVKPLVEAIWEKAYNSIANCNNIIQRIETESASLFEEGETEKNLIEGEALALRAYLHFDILRLFAPSMKKDDGKSYIPYVDTYPCTFQPYTTNNEVLKKAIADLKRAKDLVGPFDTADLKWMLTRYRFENDVRAGGGRTNLFLAYRGYRMNYFAICALLARVYNYAGMHKEAFDEASIVIEATGDSYGTLIFEPTSLSGLSDGNVKLYDELIFSLSNRDLWTNYKSYYVSTSDQLVLAERNTTDLFDSPIDMRGNAKLVKLESRKLFCLRNVEVGGTYATFVKDMIPMIRLGEMYYIRAEYYNSLKDIENAKSELDEFRSGYSCPPGMLTDDIESEIIKEVHREYLTEGQLFFYYKKFNHLPKKMQSDDSFVFPRPDSEDL